MYLKYFSIFNAFERSELSFSLSFFLFTFSHLVFQTLNICIFVGASLPETFRPPHSNHVVCSSTMTGRFCPRPFPLRASEQQQQQMRVRSLLHRSLFARTSLFIYPSRILCGNERVVVPPVYLLFVFSTSLNFASHCITYHLFFSCPFRSQPRSPTQWRGFTYRTTLSTLLLIRDGPSRRFQISFDFFILSINFYYFYLLYLLFFFYTDTGDIRRRTIFLFATSRTRFRICSLNLPPVSRTKHLSRSVCPYHCGTRARVRALVAPGNRAGDCDCPCRTPLSSIHVSVLVGLCNSGERREARTRRHRTRCHFTAPELKRELEPYICMYLYNH